MSETKHSPEPWVVVTTDGHTDIADGELPDAIRIVLDVHPADARRIVACVNACAGIQTEALEAGKLVDAVEALTHIAARDELVEASDGAFGLPAFHRCQEQAKFALRALGVLP